jgi:hypothetical protein
MKYFFLVALLGLFVTAAFAQSNVPLYNPPESTVVIDATPSVTPVIPVYSYSATPQAPVPTTVIVVPQVQPAWSTQPQTIILNVDRPAWEFNSNSTTPDSSPTYNYSTGFWDY